MACSTVRDLFDRIRRLHQEVADFAQRMGGQVAGERVHLVLAYLAKHEQHMAAAIADYEHGAAQRLLDTSFANLTTMDVDRICAELSLSPETTSDDIIRLAVSVDNGLSELYREAMEKAPSEDVRQLFQTLHANNERETRRMVRDMVEVVDF